MSSPPPARSAPANIDVETVAGFGEEWAAYDQRALDQAEWERLFAAYVRDMC